MKLPAVQIAAWLLKHFHALIGLLVVLVAYSTGDLSLDKIQKAALDKNSTSGRVWEALRDAAPVIMLVEAIFISALVGVVFFLFRARVQQAASEQRSVLFIAPKLEGFYSEYLTALVHAARVAASKKLELVVTPYIDGNSDEDSFFPERRLEEIVSHLPSKPAGVFLLPRAPGEAPSKQAIKQFCRKHADVKLVTLDVYPEVSQGDEHPHFVGGKEEEGGRIAASQAMTVIKELMCRHSPEFQNSPELRVLILIGETTEWELQRATAFEKHLQVEFNEEFNGIPGEPGPFGSRTSLTITRSKPLNYKMDRAYQYLRNYHAQLDSASNVLSHPNSYHLIFACNDDMALGAAKALGVLSEGARGRAASVPWTTRVIGYDGTSSMKTVLELGHSPISHTVCVNLKVQASRAVSVMSELIDGKQPKRFDLISPEPWSPHHT